MKKAVKEMFLFALVGIAAFTGAKAITGPRRADSAIGRQVLSLTAARPGEDTVSRMVLAGKPIILYVFDANCQHCIDQQPAWRRLARQAAGNADVFAISMQVSGRSEPDSLMIASEINYLGASSPAQLRLEFGIRGVPTTIVIDGTHRISEVLEGLQTSLALDELLERFKTP